MKTWDNVSNLAYQLAKTYNTKLHCYEFDEVEERNLGGQLYTAYQAEHKTRKAQALSSVLGYFLETSVIVPKGRFEEGNDRVYPFTFACFDNINARKEMFEAWKKMNVRNSIFIDGRLQLTDFQVYAVTLDKADRYANGEHILFDDSESPGIACSLKQTVASAMMISSIMTQLFNNHIANIKLGKDFYQIPFCTKWSGSLMKIS